MVSNGRIKYPTVRFPVCAVSTYTSAGGYVIYLVFNMILLFFGRRHPLAYCAGLHLRASADTFEARTNLMLTNFNNFKRIQNR